LDAGGAERALVQLVTRLDKSRWESHVFCLSGEGELAGVLRDAGIPVVCLGASRSRQVGVAWRLFRELKKLRPAILQTYLYHANVMGRLAGKAARVRAIVSGIRVAEKRSRLRLHLDRWTDWMVHQHVCVSDEVAQFSIAAGKLPASKICVIPNGVEIADYAHAAAADLQEFQIPSGSRTIIYVGRLDPQKGPFVLLNALVPVFSKHPALHLLMVGDGPLRGKINEWICEHRLQARVHLAGRRSDVPSLLKAAELFVLPSLWEGQPNVVLEAMAAGTPVIATDVEGISGLVRNGETGCVVRADRPTELGAAINGQLEDSANSRAMAIRAQQIVAQPFTWQRVVAEYERLYVHLAGLSS
jgi:glycosyltransferase involved in cell wall biosynthesis